MVTHLARPTFVTPSFSPGVTVGGLRQHRTNGRGRIARAGTEAGAIGAVQRTADGFTINALPITVDLFLYAGDDFALSLACYDDTGEAASFAGGSALSQIRARRDAIDTLASFTATIIGNIVTCRLTHEQSQHLPAACVWDVQLTLADGWVTTLAGGRIDVTTDVTR